MVLRQAVRTQGGGGTACVLPGTWPGPSRFTTVSTVLSSLGGSLRLTCVGSRTWPRPDTRPQL